MTDKREERRLRSEQTKELQERARRQRVLGRRVLVAVGVLAAIALALAATRKPPPATGGRVWSAEHGHWHDQ